MEYTKNKDGKFTAVHLVMKFFGATMNEMKELPIKDREELASAIARQENIPSGELSFVPVEY